MGAHANKPRVSWVNGAGLGLPGGPKRFKKVQRDQIKMAASQSAIRRFARRGGVCRISATIYETTRTILKQKLQEIIKKIVELVVFCKRKTVFPIDVVYVLKMLGETIYGFGVIHKDGTRELVPKGSI